MTFISSFTAHTRTRISLKAEIVHDTPTQENNGLFSSIRDEIFACAVKRRILAFQTALILDVLFHRLELWLL